MKPAVTAREAAKQKGPFWLRNSKGAHRVANIQRVNGRLFNVLCEDGHWFAVAPHHLLWRSPS